MFVDKFFKIIFIILIQTFFLHAEGLFDKPFATCSSMKNLGIYKTAKATVNTCSSYNVQLDFKKTKDGFSKMITSAEFPADECRRNCLILQAFEGKKLSSCVENNYVDSFVHGFVGTLNSNICRNIKIQFEG